MMSKDIKKRNSKKNRNHDVVMILVRTQFTICFDQLHGITLHLGVLAKVRAVFNRLVGYGVVQPSPTA